MKKIYYVVGSLFLLFLIIMILMLTGNMRGFDDSIYNFIFQYRSDLLDSFFKFITKFGNTISILCIVVALLLAFDKKNQRTLGIITISSVLVNTIIKNIIRRVRPDHLRLIKQGGYSFPSGHAMISIAVYGFLIYWVWNNIKNKIVKILLTIILLFIIIGIGLSRIYVGVHYPSDVLAGYVLSLGLLLTVISNIDKMGEVKNGKNGSK